MTKDSSASPHEDTWLDGVLDYIRYHRMPAALEAVLAWIVVTGCLFYYGCAYYYAAFSLLPVSRKKRLPLVTHVQQKEEESCEELYQKIRNELSEQASSREWIETIRSNEALRRLVSRFMMIAPREHELSRRLSGIWMDLLRLPERQPRAFDLSLILPAYREVGSSVAATLQKALGGCDRPESIQVVVVDAGHCTGLIEALEEQRVQTWGQLDVVEYRLGGGRGPCLNCGAASAVGSILTFLHSDTLLPDLWDSKIRNALACHGGKTTHACAFSFGHDTSSQGLRELPYPWGIRAVRFLGNIRASFFQLPYGDHIISIPASYFHFLGGYPNQAIFEDYVLMDLLRKRATVLPERLRIVPGTSAQCSVRRWQKLGVMYVTAVNATLVYRYNNSGWTAQDIHDYYYKRPFRRKKQD